MSERFIQLEKEFRGAVARRAYADIDRWCLELCRQAAEDWQQFPPGDGAGRAVFERLMETLEWSRLMLCTARASVAAELRRATLSNRFLTTGGPAESHWRVDM